MLEIAKILELLETTSDSKLNTARREYAPVKVSATESANDMLNKELGMEKEASAKLPPKPQAKAPSKESSRALSKLPQRFLNEEKAEEDIELGTPEKGAFPESLIFDEEAFSDEYGIEVETISAAYVQESEDGQIPEHLEISFEFEGSNIVLSVMADGAVEETVDGEFIEPAQFLGEIGERENEDGEVDQVLTLTLLDEESEDEESVKSEEDELTKSEGDEDHIDEDGSQITEEELIEQRGLEEDEYYATSHDMEVSKNPANRIDSRLGTSRPERSVGESRKETGKKITNAKESLAAKTNRKYKR